ncbi:hypothetical protein B0H11DRAFT_1902426 [Mycena galericulata]|nr:hypothetical protein B0H11DRAFT_1902426 [Mycena galericulata]
MPLLPTLTLEHCTEPMAVVETRLFDYTCYLRHKQEMWELDCLADREICGQKLLENFGHETDIGNKFGSWKVREKCLPSERSADTMTFTNSRARHRSRMIWHTGYGHTADPYRPVWPSAPSFTVTALSRTHTDRRSLSNSQSFTTSWFPNGGHRLPMPLVSGTIGQQVERVEEEEEEEGKGHAMFMFAAGMECCPCLASTPVAAVLPSKTNLIAKTS